MSNDTPLIKRIFDSTTKILIWSAQLFLDALAVIVIIGWFKGLEGAPEMLIAILASKDAIVAAYIWKAKAENLMKMAKSYGKKTEKEVLKQIMNIESEVQE